MVLRDLEARATSDASPTMDGTFTALLDRAGAGDEAAFRTLYEHYACGVIRVLRHLMPPDAPLRQKIDSTDLAQEAWLDLFNALKGGQRSPTEDEFRQFVAALARNRFLMHQRAADTQKRSMEREEPLTPSGDNLCAKDPNPAEAAAAAETWQIFLACLPPGSRAVMLLRRDGELVADIARQLQMSCKAVQRIIHDARMCWPGWGMSA